MNCSFKTIWQESSDAVRSGNTRNITHNELYHEIVEGFVVHKLGLFNQTEEIFNIIVLNYFCVMSE